MKVIENKMPQGVPLTLRKKQEFGTSRGLRTSGVCHRQLAPRGQPGSRIEIEDSEYHPSIDRLVAAKRVKVTDS